MSDHVQVLSTLPYFLFCSHLHLSHFNNDYCLGMCHIFIGLHCKVLQSYDMFQILTQVEGELSSCNNCKSMIGGYFHLFIILYRIFPVWVSWDSPVMWALPMGQLAQDFWNQFRKECKRLLTVMKVNSHASHSSLSLWFTHGCRRVGEFVKEREWSFDAFQSICNIWYRIFNT